MKRTSVWLAALSGVVIVCLLLAPAWGTVEPGDPNATATAPADARWTEDGWFAPPAPTFQKPRLPKQVTRAFVFPIREPIASKTYDAMVRKANHARGKGAELIVLDMDTWGGGVEPALDICRLLKTQLADIYTVCYVRTRAVSAGAMVALACDEIVLTPVGKLGDCAPLLLTGKLEGVEREKIETVLRAEFRESAERNGYPVALAESMVSWDLEVWRVRNKATRELRYVSKEDWRGRADVPPGLTSGPSRPESDWEVLNVVLAAKKLLTMTPKQAQAYGFARHLIDAPREKPLAPLMEHFHVAGEATVLTDNWSERLVGFLTHPAVMGFLFFVAILCAYVEANTPGFGIPGAVAIICFAIIFGSRFLVGLANWWEIALFVVGLALIAVELLLIPGFGVTGIIGILCCVVAILAMIVPNAPDQPPIPKTDLDWRMFEHGLFALGVAFVCSVIAGVILSKYLPQVPVASKLFLAPAEATETAPVPEDSPMVRIRVGDVGVVDSMCRPVGKVWFGEKLVDAASESGVILPGAKVRVLRRDGNRLIVEQVEPK